MQQGSDGDDLRIVLGVLKLPNSCRKEPRADNVVEQVGFTFLPGIFDRPVNERRIGNRNSRKHPTSGSGHSRQLLRNEWRTFLIIAASKMVILPA